MFEKLKDIENRYAEVEKALGDPAQISNQQRLMELSKTHAELSPIVSTYQEYQELESALDDTLLLMEVETDAEMLGLAQEELDVLTAKKEQLTEALKVLLVPKDPNDAKNVIIEIRAGTGGEEASLFAAELFRMYTRYAERQNWRLELLSSNATGLKGFKEVVFSIVGQNAYSQLKFEGGIHRVQRIPATEASGRIHTSAATVAVLPEAEELDLAIDEATELRIDTYRSSGPGGQSVNTTDSAIRITHLPTGLVVTCQDEKSQHKNRAKAMKILRARLQEQKQSELNNERAETRRSMVGSGDRSEKIRTYNFPQSRVTDHRIQFSSYQLDSVLDGVLQTFIERLTTADQAERLQED
ncbi:peptide chain release factor 1 [Candidatus Poribacteria bacterium]|nr:peptide chain release factor 1 [Candidatus Poribacteria bacterium]MXV85576.1 peptide chain release factor 1 [Candidatus Poribacteria bacterium]MYA55602.1 peptide chain release factor 1 [Candidatus Poribacteria bacterium]